MLLFLKQVRGGTDSMYPFINVDKLIPRFGFSTLKIYKNYKKTKNLKINIIW